jgi:hypothetical protein
MASGRKALGCFSTGKGFIFVSHDQAIASLSVWPADGHRCEHGSLAAEKTRYRPTTGLWPSTPLFKVRRTRLATVVYLHGRIVSRGGSQNSGLIPGYLRDRARVCIYDRANVGLSDPVPGPRTGNDAVRDLHRLLSAAHVRGPYVLLGASFGGLIAVMYAATYPEDITGMVLLDASLPDDVIKIDERFLPPDARMQPGDWKHNIEQIDSLTTYRQAHAMQRRKTNIPLTYIGTTRLDLDLSWPVEQMTAAIRAEQRAFVHRFSPGRLLILRDVPHFMERAIPQTVADEVKRVIAAASTR